MMLEWSNVSHNRYFTFTPKEVEDNAPEDVQSDGGTIRALFKIATPNIEGDYVIRVYGASAEGRGGFTEVKVKVGAGGEVPKTSPEIAMELLSTVAPQVLAGVAMVGIVLHVVAWRRIPV